MRQGSGNILANVQVEIGNHFIFVWSRNINPPQNRLYVSLHPSSTVKKIG